MPSNINVEQQQVAISQPDASGQIQHGSVEAPAQSTIAPIVTPKFAMAKGGSVAETRNLLKEGGMLDEGGTKDPISGNAVPIGAMKEEVRDDVPAQLSEGEFVIPADVVRYIGLERLMMMRQAAKEGLKKMEEMGQMSNAEEATLEDDGEFESEIDDILSELDSEKEDEGEDKETKMAEGGMVDPAVAQTQQALAQDQQPTPPAAPALTEEQMAFIQKTATGMRAQQIDLPIEKQSKPTEGLKSVDIIREDGSKNKDPAKVEAFITKVEKLVRANKVLLLRHNDTVTIGFIKPNGAIDPLVFTKDTPERVAEAAEATLTAAKKAGIKRIESNANADTNVAIFNKLGYPAKKEDPKTGIAWSLDLE
jgi:hypothetical protein